MPSIVDAKGKNNSIVLERMFSYSRDYTPGTLTDYTTNVYILNNFNVWKRNFTLWLIPSMYSIAEGDRTYLSETYNRVKFRDFDDYDLKRHVSFSTIRHNRHTMSITKEFLKPNLYGTCLYKDHILSPFSRNNHKYYRYRYRQTDGDSTIILFKPRLLKNTQLVSGNACVQTSTGRIIRATFDGEYDMMRFHTETTLGDSGVSSLLPKQCKTHLVFKFVGNHVYFNNEAVFDCPEMPDSLNDVFDAQMMDSIRPVKLSESERQIFDKWLDNHKPDTTAVIDTVRHFNFAKDILQDAIGDNLVTSLRFETSHAYMKLSPILNPQYVSYSSTHGLAYKIKLGAYYNLDEKRRFEFQPWCGYNFKYKKFYFTIPLYYYYVPEKNGLFTIIYGNGNRIGNGGIMEEIKREFGDTLKLGNKQLEYFDDNYLTVSNNIAIFKGFDLTAGLTYHKRVPYKPDVYRKYGKPRSYNSLAPMISLKLKPWQYGPLFSIDYERGLKGLFEANIDYERWEFDGSWKFDIQPLRKLNARFGGGFYTRKKSNYFVDYAHFRDNKLPGGWDDDWSGDFQLLNSSWYNESRYYARTHFSYESPFLVGTWLPLLGRIIEKERLYFSALSIEHTRPYCELGYGFSTRFVTVGLFASFLNGEFQKCDAKFTFELFRRW